jgi:hypothetical protein
MPLLDAFLIVLGLYLFVIGFEFIFMLWMGMKK